MRGLDLLTPFVCHIKERHRSNPEINLEDNLKKANVALSTYAESIGCSLENLSIMQICVDEDTLHMDLVRHIESLPISNAYRGQNRSRIKLLIKNLSWPAKENAIPSHRLSFQELLPEHLQAIWRFFAKVPHPHRQMSRKEEKRESYLDYRSTLPLSNNGICVALALLEISRTDNITDVRTLLEEHFGNMKIVLKRRNHPSKWGALIASALRLRKRVREYLKYYFDKKTRVAIERDMLPEPLRTQIDAFEEKAHNGFKSDIKIKILARTKYKLDLGHLAGSTIRSYIYNICLVLGYIPKGMYGDELDIRDLLKLTTREVEVEGVIQTELYNLFADYYRNMVWISSSVKREEGFDNATFELYINGITAVAAYSGFLRLRQAFLKEYKPTIDTNSREKNKLHKKEVFDRPWLDREMQRLYSVFYLIAVEGSFKSTDGYVLNKDQRRNLNLCLFYIALLTLRFLGVRQQCIRDCIVDENIFFVTPKGVFFEWTVEEVKNRKGIRHCLNAREHAETHLLLINSLWIYNKKIYPYLSGANNTNQSISVMEKRKEFVAGQFFLKCGSNGLCTPFTNESVFCEWFKRQSKIYLEFEGRLQAHMPGINPHFLRAMYGDWLRFDLGFSKEEAGDLAADHPDTFESDYVTHPLIYDATPLWTLKNAEIKGKKLECNNT